VSARAACALALAAFAAAAYVPSAGSLLRKAAARAADGTRSREVTLEGLFSAEGGKPEPRTLSLHFPLSCRFEGGAQVRATVATPVVRADRDGPDAALLELACPLIAYRNISGADAEKVLRGAAEAGGADLTSAISLDRLGDRVAIVLGAQPRQIDRPQLWLYKDSLAPARLVARKDGRLADLRLYDYGNPAAADWFPRILELREGDKTVARFEVLETRGFREAARGDDENGR
jgi:hypothetical protein